ncbi:hypothetical protein [Lacrimispora sp.]|uniref:hypothetical protein n=1 Tax=Lacrimispora sp. TaxID=2719234 RepID=UPI0032E3A476
MVESKEGTMLNKEEGPENNVPHFYADLKDILSIFHNFDIEKIHHTDYCYINNDKKIVNIII